MIFYIKVNDCPYTETVEWWYNEIRMKHYNTREYYTTNQIRIYIFFTRENITCFHRSFSVIFFTSFFLFYTKNRDSDAFALVSVFY